MSSMGARLRRELQRFQARYIGIRIDKKELQLLQSQYDNQPYELYDLFCQGRFSPVMPDIRSASDTAREILEERASLSRFGDGEFRLMNGGEIGFQGASPSMAMRLNEVLVSSVPGLLIGLPDCFGSLGAYTPPVADFWRRWMSNKRQDLYRQLDMTRVYHSAFFSRAFMPYVKTVECYDRCAIYFDMVKEIWKDREVLICEGEGTRFGLFNDLLAGAADVSRILCPAENAYDKYDDILAAAKEAKADTLILIALGPTATILAHDLAMAGHQAIDVGHLDIEYEWFLRKDEEGLPIDTKYVDGSKAGRRVHKIDSAEYEAQIKCKVL